MSDGQTLSLALHAAVTQNSTNIRYLQVRFVLERQRTSRIRNARKTLTNGCEPSLALAGVLSANTHLAIPAASAAPTKSLRGHLADHIKKSRLYPPQGSQGAAFTQSPSLSLLATFLTSRSSAFFRSLQLLSLEQWRNFVAERTRWEGMDNLRIIRRRAIRARWMQSESRQARLRTSLIPFRNLSSRMYCPDPLATRQPETQRLVMAVCGIIVGEANMAFCPTGISQRLAASSSSSPSSKTH
jgi:hypothetical protein